MAKQNGYLIDKQSIGTLNRVIRKVRRIPDTGLGVKSVGHRPPRKSLLKIVDAKIVSGWPGNVYTADIYENGYYEDDGTTIKNITHRDQTLVFSMVANNYVIPTGTIVMAVERNGYYAADFNARIISA